MSRWWRAYDEALDDPKLQQLSDSLFKAWFNLCCLTSQNGGTLPPIEAIAFKLRLKRDRAQRVVSELRQAKLLDETDGQLHPHNWNGRQFKSDVSNERVKRHRERQRNVTSTVTETPPETESDTEPETDTSSLRSEVTRARAADRVAFDQFWKRYPHKVGKKAAFKAFVIACKSEDVTPERIMFALEAYVNKTDDRPWCNPATWLNQGRWDDQPAAGVKGNGNGKSLLNALDKLEEHLSRDDDHPARQDDLLSLPPR